MDRLDAIEELALTLLAEVRKAKSQSKPKKKNDPSPTVAAQMARLDRKLYTKKPAA